MNFLKTTFALYNDIVSFAQLFFGLSTCLPFLHNISLCQLQFAAVIVEQLSIGKYLETTFFRSLLFEFDAIHNEHKI